MWHPLNNGLKLLLAASVLLLCSYSAYSQDVNEMTDQQLLTELMTILTELETDNQKLQESLTTAQSSLSEARLELDGLRVNYQKAQQLSIIQQQELDELKTYWQNYRDEQKRKIILTGLLSGLSCAAVGVVIGLAQ